MLARWQNLSDALRCVVLGMCAFLVLVPFVYRGGFGEPDVGAMMGGAYQATLTKSPTALYFHQGQPLYNQLLMGSVRALRLNFDTFALMFNLLACASIAASVGLLAWLCRKVASWAGTLIGVISCLFTPLVFDLGTYAHPQTLSIALMLASIALILRAADHWPAERGAASGFMVASLLIGIFGLLVRMDGILLLPMLAALTLLLNWPWRKLITVNVGIAALVAIGAVLMRPLFMGSVPKPESGNGGILGDLLTGLAQSSSGNLLRGAPVFVMAAGVGTLVVACGAIAYAFFKSDYRAIVCAAVAFIPVFYYSVLNPFVTRRFIHSLVIGGFCLAVLMRGLGKASGVTERKARPKHSKSQLKAQEVGHPGKFLFAVFGITLVAGNFVFWPALSAFFRMVDDPFPAKNPWKQLEVTLLQRHFINQSYITWARDAYIPFARSLNTDTELIGGWTEHGNLMAAFSRARIPVEIKSFPSEGPGCPSGTEWTLPNAKLRYFSPPWDMPPPQKFANVVLLDHYPSDVGWKRSNISIFVPSAGIRYLSW